MAASRQLGILRTVSLGVVLGAVVGLPIFACALNPSGMGQGVDAGVDRDATVPTDGGGPDAGPPDAFLADGESSVDTGPTPDVTSDSNSRDGAPDAGADVVDAGSCGDPGETLLDLAGLPRLVALRHLRSLVERGIVAVSSQNRPPP